MVGNSHPCISEGDWWQVSRKQDMDGGNLLSSNNGKKYSLSSKFFKSVFDMSTIFDWSKLQSCTCLPTMVGNSHPCISEGDWWQESRKQDTDGGNLLTMVGNTHCLLNSSNQYSIHVQFFGQWLIKTTIMHLPPNNDWK